MKKLLVYCLISLCIICISDGCRPKNEINSGSVNVNGNVLAYVTEGKGKPCLVYGLHQYHRKSFTSAFKNQLRCTFVDSRYAVPSAPADTLSPFTIDAAVEEIEAIRKALDMHKFVLVGHSVLGLIALEYAKKYPGNVSHIIAIAAMPEVSKNRIKSSEEYWNKNASAKLKETLAANWTKLIQDSVANWTTSDVFISSIAAYAPESWYDSVYNENHLLVGRHYNVPVLNQLFAQDFFLFKDSVKVKPPVFLAMGKYDFVCPYPDWEKYLGMFDDINFQVFDNSGHYPQIEEAEKFDKLVLSWLDSR